jgi:GNAT superfamily N-acetyltransferase
MITTLRIVEELRPRRIERFARHLRRSGQGLPYERFVLKETRTCAGTSRNDAASAEDPTRHTGRRSLSPAWYESSPITKLLDGRATAQDFQRELNPPPGDPRAIAESNSEAVGFALYFFNFSTFVGRPGLYLEDLFVRPARRAHGIGRALLRALARIARERGCGRMEWAVLDWNEPALNFYQSLGARQMKEWIVHRLTRAEIEKLAAES